MNGYLQGFIITMETGQIVKVLVKGEDRQHALGLAHNMAKELCDNCQAWDDCAFPVTDEEHSRGEYARILEA